MLLQRQPAAGLDDDALDLMALTIVDRVIAAPRSMHLEVTFGDLRRDALEPADQPLQPAGVLLRGTPARHPAVATTTRSSTPSSATSAFSVRDVAVAGILEHRPALRGVAGVILVRQLPHRVPGADVGPAAGRPAPPRRDRSSPSPHSRSSSAWPLPNASGSSVTKPRSWPALVDRLADGLDARGSNVRYSSSSTRRGTRSCRCSRDSRPRCSRPRLPVRLLDEFRRPRAPRRSGLARGGCSRIRSPARSGVMPKVTMLPGFGGRRPARQAAMKAALSRTTWSAASASTTASLSRVCAKAAAAAIAGPESRRAGSSSTSASMPISASCSSTMKR